MKEGFFFDRINMDSAWFPVDKAVKRAILIHSCPALAVLS